MKTTFDLDANLFKRAKVYAAQNGTTLKSLVESALEQQLSGGMAHAPKRRLSFPILKSKRPGSLKLSNAKIEEFLA